MNNKKKFDGDAREELERRLKEKPIPKRPKDPPDAYQKLAEGLMHPTKCKADRETERTESEVKLKKKAAETPEPKAKEKPRAGPSFSVTEINVSKEEKPQLCTKEAALGIFTGWWQDGVLKAELKPVKVLKVLYAMVEENSEELRVKVVALCKLANGKKRRMAAKKYQKRSADRPHFVLVEPTKKPDGDELFNDTPIGRDEFAEKAIASHKARKEDARRYMEELKRREGLDEGGERDKKADAKSYVAELDRREAESRRKKKGKRRRDDDD